MQRIAISAARTASAAKPPVSAPAIVPPALGAAGLPFAAGLQTEESFDIETQRQQVPRPAEAPGLTGPHRQPEARTEHVAPPARTLPPELPPCRPIHENAPATPEKVIVRAPVTATARPDGAPSPLPPALPHAPVGGPVVRAPKGLRRVPDSERSATAEGNIPRNIASEARASTSAPQRDTPLRTTSEAPAQDFLKTPKPVSRMPIMRSAQILSRTDAPSLAVPTISSQEPGLEPAQPPVEALPEAATDRVDQNTSMRQVQPSAVPEASRPAACVRSLSEPVADNMTSIVVRVAPSQPAAATPSPAAVKRHRQISIGRIDVQVNNAAQAADTPAAASAKPLRQFDFLEARYLSRFSLKP